jgi:hypothetical protein
MRASRTFLVVASIFLLVCLAWAEDPWKEKLWTEWTQDDVKKVLLKSPWVKSIRIGRIRPSGGDLMDKPVNTAGLNKNQAENEAVLLQGEGSVMPRPVTQGRSEAPPPGTAAGASRPVGAQQVVTLRWFSSRTVKQALIRNWQIQLEALPGPGTVEEVLRQQNPEAAQDTQQVARVKQQVGQKRVILQENIGQMQARLADDGSLFEIVVSPVILSESSRESLSDFTYLQPRKSKEKIPAAKIVPSGQSFIFYFPREVEGRPIIGPEEKKVRFHTKLGKQKIQTDFDLRKMLRNGQPDL